MRALLSVFKHGSDSAVNPVLVEGVTDKQTCLDLAWAASLKPKGWESSMGATVTCLQDGRIIAIQTCRNGECYPATAPSMK